MSKCLSTSSLTKRIYDSQVKASSNMHKRASDITDQASNLLTEEGNIRVLRVRNPWGKKEWQGQFGDKSDVWTQRLRKLLDRGDWLLCCAALCFVAVCIAISLLLNNVSLAITSYLHNRLLSPHLLSFISY